MLLSQTIERSPIAWRLISKHVLKLYYIRPISEYSDVTAESNEKKSVVRRVVGYGDVLCPNYETNSSIPLVTAKPKSISKQRNIIPQKPQNDLFIRPTVQNTSQGRNEAYCDVTPQKDENDSIIWPASPDAMVKARSFLCEWWMIPIFG